eukprot:COSAG02_NODE_64849_length_259_cov_0.956250_1_plen_25_part_01
MHRRQVFGSARIAAEERKQKWDGWS